MVAEPSMIARLEQLIPVLEERRDWKLGAVVGACAQTVSCFRAGLMNRSRLVGMSAVSLRAVCYLDKVGEDGVREAVAWRMPRHGVTKFDVGGVLWRLWHALPHPKGEPCTFLIFDHLSGNALSHNMYQDAVREVLET